MARGEQFRRRIGIALAILVVTTAAVIIWRGSVSGRPGEHSPGYHLDPTELAAMQVDEVGPGVRVLCYHYFRPDFAPGYLLRVVGAVMLGMPTLGPQEFWTTPIGQFERHLRYFRDEGIPVLTLDDIASRQRRGEPLPDPAVVITIDDADRSVYELAWPLLKKYDIQAHLFVPTGRVDSHWSGIEVCTWPELREMSDSGTLVLGSHTHDLHFKVGTDLGRQPVFWNPDRIGDRQRERAQRELGDLTDATPTSERERVSPLAENPVAADLLLSRRLLERHTGRDCRWLAWPYGFGNGALDSLAAHVGFSGTLSLRPTSVDDETPSWHLGRFTLTAKTTPADIAALFAADEED